MALADPGALTPNGQIQGDAVSLLTRRLSARARSGGTAFVHPESPDVKPTEPVVPTKPVVG